MQICCAQGFAEPHGHPSLLYMTILLIEHDVWNPNSGTVIEPDTWQIHIC